MDQPPTSAEVIAGSIIAASAVVSLAVLFRLFVRHIDGQPLLRYEPRGPVPWNFIAPLLLIGPPAIGIARGIFGDGAPTPEPEYLALNTAYLLTAGATSPATWLSSLVGSASAVRLTEQIADAAEMTAGIWTTAIASITLALACYAMLAALFGATVYDLGLPTSWRQFGRDVKIGAVAFAASLAPIYAMMLLLNLVFQPKQGHPLIEQFIVSPSLSLMAATVAAAVISAPLFEETAFRLVLQGWLERWTGVGCVEQRETHRDVVDGAFRSAARTLHEPQTGAWTPIAITSVLFGLAHYGQGVAPVPLMLLGVVMGYVYQRTHRVVPGMICHLLFNAYSLGLVWLQFGPGE